MPSGYYNIDEILAEDELIPCKARFDFAYLSHLDPDNNNYPNTVRRSNNENDDPLSSSSLFKDGEDLHHYLKEGSQIMMPLWSIRKWSDLNYIELNIPKMYRRKCRERLLADPTASSDWLLQTKNSSSSSSSEMSSALARYFDGGKKWVDLVMNSSTKLISSLRSSSSVDRRERDRRIMQLEHLQEQAKVVQATLSAVYRGVRLQHTMDWSLSCGCSSTDDDGDVSAYTSMLSDLERRLFYYGRIAADNHQLWKLYGNRRLKSSSTLTPTTSARRNTQKQPNTSTAATNVNNADKNTYQQRDKNNQGNKRLRTT